MKFKKEDLVQIICGLLFVKILITGLSYSDGLGAFVLLGALQLDRALAYLYPKRADVYLELSKIQGKLAEVAIKADETQSDVTALKIGSVRR